MKPSNYSILFNPVPRLGGFGPLIQVSDEFVEFAKKQELNKEKYEELVRDALITFDFEKSLRDYSDRSFCYWEVGGLLHHVIVPGNAAGIALEEGINGMEYVSDNIDNPNQAMILFTVMLHYLNDLESRISE